jgi:hypothetical protein
MKLLKEHQKADKRMKILIEDRLVDANFSSEAGLLANGDYEGYIELVRKDYKFHEKLEVTPKQSVSALKTPSSLKMVLRK